MYAPFKVNIMVVSIIFKILSYRPMPMDLFDTHSKTKVYLLPNYDIWDTSQKEVVVRILHRNVVRYSTQKFG